MTEFGFAITSEPKFSITFDNGYTIWAEFSMDMEDGNFKEAKTLLVSMGVKDSITGLSIVLPFGAGKVAYNSTPEEFLMLANWVKELQG